MSEFLFNVKSIIKKLKEILKCDICHSLFDFNNHMPLITISGETFCKQCLSGNKSVINKNNRADVLSPFKFIENLKLKIILKDIVNLYDKTINEQFIVFSKQLTERNNNQRFGHYLLTYNNSTTGLRENNSKEFIYNNSNKKINSLTKALNNLKNNLDNNIHNPNNNINKNDKKENDNNNSLIGNKEKNYKIISKEINLKNSTNKIENDKFNLKTLNINNLNISNIDDNLNTMTLNDEINIQFNNNNQIFEEKNNNMKEIDDESIETIPINEEKSTVNMSFKKEFNDFWFKKEESQGELINPNENKNDLNKYVFINKNNLINKNNPNIISSTLNIKKKNELNKKIIEKEKKFSYQLSEPNLDNIKYNKFNCYFYDIDKQLNDKKEEEKSPYKNNDKEVKKIYNSNYFQLDLNNKNDNDNNINFLNNKTQNKIKEYNKINTNKYHVPKRNIISNEIKRKIEEDEKGDNIFKFKNLTSIKDYINQNKFRNNNILFDEDEIKIKVKDINNVYDNEEEENNLLITDNNKIRSSMEQKNNEKNDNPIFTKNNSKIKHAITYNKKILGKTNLSPLKNKSIENSDKKNVNKYDNFKNVNFYINNREKFRTISQSKIKEKDINNKNSLNNDLFPLNSTRERNIESINDYNKYNQNNLKCIPKITSIFLKIDKKMKNNNNKSTNNIKENNTNISENNNSDYNSKNDYKIKYITDEKNISNKIMKTFMNKTKDELDNFYMDNYSNIKNKNKSINNLLSNKKFLEIKIKEFNKLFEQKISKEKNLNIRTILLKNKQKYEEIIKNSINYPLFNESFDEIKMIFLPNYDFYIGIIQNNLPQKGILYSSDGNYYEGTFLNGKKDGKGIIIYKNGAKYEGELKNNLHNGVGKLSQLDGEIFIGEWKEGKINGNGIRYHNNGDIYSGHYINSIRDGTGKYIFSNGDSYEGKWKNGKANGKGIYKFKNGNIYEGNFENNIFCGQGCFKKKKGDIYIGEFKNGVLNGEGTIINKEKEKFIGTFKDGKKHGKGVLYDSNGNIIKSGIWESNKFLE